MFNLVLATDRVRREERESPRFASHPAVVMHDAGIVAVAELDWNRSLRRFQMTTKNPKKQMAVNPHPKGKGREHVEHSHDLKKMLAKSPTAPKRFSHSAMGNR